MPDLQVKRDLASLLLGVCLIGAPDHEPLAVVGHAEARAEKVLPQFG